MRPSRLTRYSDTATELISVRIWQRTRPTAPVYNQQTKGSNSARQTRETATEGVALVEFIYLVFTGVPGRLTVGDSGLCRCVPCLSTAIISITSLCLLVSVKHCRLCPCLEVSVRQRLPSLPLPWKFRSDKDYRLCPYLKVSVRQRLPSLLLPSTVSTLTLKVSVRQRLPSLPLPRKFWSDKDYRLCPYREHLDVLRVFR